jgi:hypothetical protein
MKDLIEDLEANGLTRDDARLCIDMANHAAVQAAETMIRVVDTLPERLRSHAALLTILILSDRLNETADKMMKILMGRGSRPANND